MVRRLTLLLGLCLVAAGAQAGQADRDAFRRAFDLIEAGKLEQASDLALTLSDYALFPYLEWGLARARLRRDADKADSDVRHFLANYPKLPPAGDLHREWLRSMVRREHWRDFLAAYDDPGTRRLQCYHAVARIELGRDEGLRAEALELWNVGYSQPRACDRVFAWMDAHGGLTPEAVDKRLRLAMDAGNLGLAEYLAKKLPEPRRGQVLKKIALYRVPDPALETLARDPDPAVSADSVFVALYGLALNEPEEAIQLLPRLAAAYDFSDASRARITARIALGFAVEHDPRALDWFARVDPKHLTETTRAWRIRAALYHGRWQIALDWIDTLPEDERGEPQWRYWRARTLEEIGSPQQAQAIYASVADGLGFYAYLSAGRGGHGYRPSGVRLQADAAAQQALMTRPGLIRARELFAVGLLDFARTEWDRVMRGEPDADQRQAALLASRWGWHTQSIRALVRGGGGRDLSLRYPLAFRDLVVSRADALDLRPAWVFGLMRSESLFQPDVYSYAGAMGLMQLMPGTARQVAAELGIRLERITDVLQPEINVTLGMRYLRNMLDRFHGNVLAATAAYNAGPNNVETWLPAEPRAADVWVENIPYVQTRHYVKRVMATAAIFEWRLRDRVLPASYRLQPVGRPPAKVARNH